MNNTQKVLKNQHICEQATPNLGICFHYYCR